MRDSIPDSGTLCAMGVPARLRTVLVRTAAVTLAAACLGGAVWGGLYLLDRAPEVSRAQAATESYPSLSQGQSAVSHVLSQEVESFAVALFLRSGSSPVTSSALAAASQEVTASLRDEGVEGVMEGRLERNNALRMSLRLLAGEECAEVPLARDVSGIFVSDGVPSACAADDTDPSPAGLGSS